MSPDLTAKPFFELQQHVRDDLHQTYDWLDMNDGEWAAWKDSGEQLDDRIVECAWHPPTPQDESAATWHIKRIRSDKTNANHRTVVSRIIQSIRDGVEQEEVRALMETR